MHFPSVPSVLTFALWATSFHLDRRGPQKLAGNIWSVAGLACEIAMHHEKGGGWRRGHVEGIPVWRLVRWDPASYRTQNRLA